MISTRRFAFLLVAAIAASACSGGGDDADSPETSQAPTPATAATDGTAATTSAPTTETTDSTPDLTEVEAIAVEWLANDSEIDAAIGSQLVVATTTAAPGVSHVTFDQVIGDRRVRGSSITVHVLDNGDVQGANESLTDATASDGSTAIEASAAAAIAIKAVDGTVSDEPGVEPIWVQNGRELIPAFLVSLQTSDPSGAWQIVVDGLTSGVLAVDTATPGTRQGRKAPLGAIGATVALVARQTDGDQCSVPASPSACVFLVDPATSTGQAVEPTNANDFLRGVSLQGLVQRDQLVGEFVSAAPGGTPIVPDPEPDGIWGGGVGSRNFEATMAYYWIDTTQRLMQRLGFSVRADDPTLIAAVDAAVVDNAFFDYVADAMFLGVGSNGINAGQDASVIIHEYGHGVLFSQIGIDALQGHEVSAYGEGFGDLLAVLSTIEYRPGDPACFGSWFVSTNGCLRRMDTDLTYPGDLTQEVHDDGSLFAGAVWDIFEGLLATEGLTTADCAGGSCNGVRDRLLTVILGAHYYLSPGANFVDIANGYLFSNQAAFTDADRAVFEAGFAVHGLLGGGSTGLDEGGQSTGDAPADASVGIDISHDYRGDLFVSVGVVDADFDLLCDEVVIAMPDGNDDADNIFGLFDISDSACAPLLPPSPDRLWYLFVSDELNDDRGEILDFVVFDGDDPYPSGGLPIPIPDADPEGTFTLIDGTTLDVAPENQANPGAPVDGQPFITLDITHEYGGDLFIRAGVADANSDIICSVPIRDPDPSNDSGGIIGSIDMSACAQFYPPAPNQEWFLQAIDTAAVDIGTIDQFTVTGADGTVFEFMDVPIDIPDNDETGIALLLNATSGSNGQAGGAGQSSSVELPAVTITMTHGYTGDLAVTAGVADANFDVLCEVAILTPDPTDDSVDPEGEISLAECAEFYPPSPDRQFYLFVRDTLTGDTGTIDTFVLVGPDGRVFDLGGLPVEVPDADQTGIAVFIDGDKTDGDGSIVASFVISHTYVGDLEILAGVADANNIIVCEVVIALPDPLNDQVDVFGDVDLTECGAFYPPAPDQVWFVQAIDEAAFDEGSIDAFVLTGPDGDVRQHGLLPAAIPDDDPTGLAVFFDE